MFHIIIFSNILLYFVIFVFLFVARTDPTVSCEQLRSFPADVDNQGSMSFRFGEKIILKLNSDKAINIGCQ